MKNKSLLLNEYPKVRCGILIEIETLQTCLGVLMKNDLLDFPKCGLFSGKRETDRI